MNDHAKTLTQHSQNGDAKNRQLPIMTIIIFALTVLGNLLQLIFPPVLSAFRRNPAQLQAGQWWRLVTPLFVQSGGWLAFVFVTAGLGLVGIAVERCYGHSRWLLFYGVGGLVGELAGYAWNPNDFGSSVAVCGLIGSLIAYLIWRPITIAAIRQRRETVIFASLLYALGLIGNLVGSAGGTTLIGGIVGAVLASALIWLFQSPTPPHIIVGYISFVSVVSGLLLTVHHDIHGPPLLAGLTAGALLWIILPPRATHVE